MGKATKPDRVEQYALDHVHDRINVGEPVRLACKRHLDDLRRAKELGLEWRPGCAESAFTFFEQTLFINDGQPFILEPFEAFIVGSVFGWYNADGFRRFRTAYNEIGKGNGKTPLAAGIGLYGLEVDDEEAPEIYAAATTQEQAGICFKDACRMVALSSGLSHITEQVNSLIIPSRYAVFRPLSSEHRGLDGKRPHIALIDELHEHPSAVVVDKIRAGTKARRNALIFEITNSGYDRHSVCWQHHEYSLKVLNGIIRNDSWFAYICALDKDDDWTDEGVWRKANPGLDTILPRSYLREQVKEAQGMPSKENIVKRLNFCVWTEQSVRWIPLDKWDLGAVPVFTEDELAGRTCYGGMDLARVNDLTALALVFYPDDPDGKIKIVMRFWCPEDDIGRRSLRDRVPYDVWKRQGLIKTTPGNATDFDFVRHEIVELAGRFQIKEIAYDRVFAGELVTNLQNDGMTIVPHGQGFLSMATPTAELERLIISNRIAHNGHPILRWNASNVAVQTDPAGNIKPDKERSVERIDGIVALIMGIGRAMLQPQGATGGFAFA